MSLLIPKGVVNIFYEENEDKDRWVKLDRYPRRIVRRLARGKSSPGGQMRVFLNLCDGFKRLGVPFRVNNYSYIERHSEEIACVIGKPHVLYKLSGKNRIIFGAAICSHPSDEPALLERFPVRKILVPGEWMREMCAPAWGEKVIAWPAGIDTNKWKPAAPEEKDYDVLLYDKVMWGHDRYGKELINPINRCLEDQGLRVATLRYGFYREEEFLALLKRSKAMVFLCEHETQGIAYQQALSCEVPILAWDRGGFWQDPAYYPHKVRFSPVSSVPYWDERCGLKFKDAEEFPSKLEEFLDLSFEGKFAPRNYIMDNLTLEKSARRYLEIYKQVQSQ
jgi:glycosyltransferase involved in cell wall biosynthesis